MLYLTHRKYCTAALVHIGSFEAQETAAYLTLTLDGLAGHEEVVDWDRHMTLQTYCGMSIL
jgi:hypothetical protein